MPNKAKMHIKDVDLTLEHFRALCLGQHKNLTDILPASLQGQALESQADFIARQLLFALIRVAKDSISAEQYQQAHKWLSTLILYLLREYRNYDQTFFNLHRLIFLPSDTRQILFENYNSPQKTFLLFNSPPDILRNFDVVTWWLLDTLKLTAEAEKAHSAIQNILLNLTP